jgi:hypothetical protein
MRSACGPPEKPGKHPKNCRLWRFKHGGSALFHGSGADPQMAGISMPAEYQPSILPYNLRPTGAQLPLKFAPD